LRVERLSINHGGSGERVLLVIHGNGAEAFLETNEEAVLFATPGDSGPLLVVATPRARGRKDLASPVRYRLRLFDLKPLKQGSQRAFAGLANEAAQLFGLRADALAPLW